MLLKKVTRIMKRSVKHRNSYADHGIIRSQKINLGLLRARNSLITRQSTTQTDVIYIANINLQSVVASEADDSLQ
jgi:hypothetical protein